MIPPTVKDTPTQTLTPTPSFTVVPTQTPTATTVPHNGHVVYVYDGDGNLVKSIIGDVVTYYPNGSYELKVSGSNEIITKYYSAGSSRIAYRINGTITWLLNDHLGSTVGTVDEDGELIGTLKYTAYGELRTGSSTTDYRYTGQREESEIGLYFYVARFFDPAVGRFISADTLLPDPNNPAAYDRYAYVYFNPINGTDPSGHCLDEDGDGSCDIKYLNPDDTYISGFSKEALADAHQEQVGNECGAYSLAMVLTLLTESSHSGEGVAFDLSGILPLVPGTPPLQLALGAELLTPHNAVTYQQNGNIGDLIKNINNGQFTLVGVSWQTNQEMLSQIEENIANGDDLFYKVNPGHWMVAVGYNETNREIMLLDPGQKPSEGQDPFSTISYRQFYEIWVGKTNFAIGNGDMISIR